MVIQKLGRGRGSCENENSSVHMSFRVSLATTDASDFLSRTNKLTSNSLPTPMLPSEKLLLVGGEKLSHQNTTHY